MSDTGPQLKLAEPVEGRATSKTRHNFYFYEMVYIEVENTQYYVPKMGLNRPGTVFWDMFSLPPGDADDASGRKGVEGSSEDNPIVLPVSSYHFQAFLRVLYPAGPEVGGPGANTTKDEVIGILELSTMWRFTKIRTQAIKTLERMLQAGLPKSATDCVLLGRKHHVKDWVFLGYNTLVQLTTDEFNWRELQALGLDLPTICDISSIRQRITDTGGSDISLEWTSDPYGLEEALRSSCDACGKPRLGRFWECRDVDSDCKLCEKCFKFNDTRSKWWSPSVSNIGSNNDRCESLVLSTFKDELAHLEMVEKELSGE